MDDNDDEVVVVVIGIEHDDDEDDDGDDEDEDDCQCRSDNHHIPLNRNWRHLLPIQMDYWIAACMASLRWDSIGNLHEQDIWYLHIELFFID